MKTLIRFLFVLVLGAALGYVFYNSIDSKLKARFGAEKIEKVKAVAEEKFGDVAEKIITAGKAGVKAIKESLDSTK